MTKDEFIAGYCERSKVTWESLSKYKVALPCACNEDYCDGWAMVSNQPHLIEDHMRFYAPQSTGDR